MLQCCGHVLMLSIFRGLVAFDAGTIFCYLALIGHRDECILGAP